MAKMTWDQTGYRFFHTGVSDVALFMLNAQGTYGGGIPWSGVTGITQSPDGADAQNFYADNIKYLSIRAKENWKGTIKCFQYPAAFKAALGKKELVAGSKVYIGQQSRQSFGLVWKTKYGNDSAGEDYGHIIHIAYGLTAGPSEEENNTTNETPEINEFSFDLESTPAQTTDGTAVTSYVELNSTEVASGNLTTIEEYIYGSVSSSTYSMPTLDWLKTTLTQT